MNIKTLENGDLEMVADNNDLPRLRRILKDVRNKFSATTMVQAESQFVREFLIDPMGIGLSYRQVAPEEVGALTRATLISDGRKVWGDMNYQVQSFIEELVAGRTVRWTLG